MIEQSKSQALTPNPLISQTPTPNLKIQNRKSKIQNLALALLILLYLAIALAHAVLAPLTTGPDELAHYEYVHFIADHGRLPLDSQERSQASYKSDQPPLYHLLAALPAVLIDPTGPPFLKRVNDHPRRQLIERTRHAWGLYNTEDERWPYRAEILRWHIGRWVAILFGAGTVAITFFIARNVFVQLSPPTGRASGEEELPPPLRRASGVGEGVLPALGAAALVAFIPRYALTGSMLNYETTLAFFAALFLWALLRMASGRWQVADGRWQMANDRKMEPGSDLRPILHIPYVRHYPLRFTFYALLLGLFAGLAILTKLSALMLPLEAVIALWLMRRYYGWTWRLWLRLVLTTLATTLVVISFWFGFILYQFNTVAEDGLWVGLLRPLLAADASDATTNQLLSFLTGGQAGFTEAIENLETGPPWEWASIFFRTFWMVGIENVQPLAPVALIIALALCLAAAVGLIGVWRSAEDSGSKIVDSELKIVDRGLKPVDREQKTIFHLPSPIRHASRPSTTLRDYPLSTIYDPPSLRLLLSLLLLHLTLPLILPLLRYVVTYSLADTAQGRHLLFSAAPAFAILLVWGLMNFTQQVRRNTQHATRNTSHAFHSPLPAFRFPLPTSHLISLFPALFVLTWTGVQLWTMTWAYNPPLPVSTLPAAQAQATHQLNQSLNEVVTLVGYNSQIDLESRVLRLDLLWRATAISPVDYLTEVSLLDAEGQTQAQWLGYSANGRYPTRAWDVGDMVRDTIWLPIAGLPAGSYQLSLNLIPTSQNDPAHQAIAPLNLTQVSLENPSLRLFNDALPFTDQAVAAAGFSVWRNGMALTVPEMFRYRETILVTLSPLLPDQQRTVRLIGPDKRSFAPVRELNNTALFIVGPDWSSGNYHLQVTVTSSTASETQQVNSGTILSVLDFWQRQFTLPIKEGQERYIPVEANFANQVKLLGYDLGANRAEPGGGIPLTLYWQGLDWMGNDYTIFTKLLAADGTVHGGRDRLPREGYRTIYWAPGEIITDPFGAPVKADAPDGVYTLNIGLYKQVGQQAVSLPLVQDGQPIDTTSINIGPIKIGGPPPGLTLKTAHPQHPLNQPFGDAPNLMLLGYEFDQLSIDNCQLTIDNCQLSITLYWRSESLLPLNYTTFVHLRNAGGDIVAQHDQPPLDGAYPTSLWDPGEIIADKITLSLPANLPSGEYQIVVGMYDLPTGQRLVVPGNPANEVNLTDVTLP
jgi:hypothetical protein